MNGIRKFLSRISLKQCLEFGMSAILVMLALAIYRKDNNLVIAAFAVTLVTVIAPILFFPFAALWFGLSEVLRMISTTIILGAVFIIIVMPVGLVRKIAGLDNLKLKEFKKGRQSVMIVRDHTFRDEDLTNTF
jgi:polyferredoxin